MLTENKRYNRIETASQHLYGQFEWKGFKNEEEYEGFVKCRLIHERGGSIVIPDFIFLENGWIQPFQFIAPILADLGDIALCDFMVDISCGETIKVRITNEDLIKTYPDKSHLYKCKIFGPKNLKEHINGDYQTINDELYLNLFHHTNDAGYAGIMSSKELRSSQWNIRGTKEIKNSAFPYFTHIDKIINDDDLKIMAMSSNGEVEYWVDGYERPQFLPPNYRKVLEDRIYVAPVYRNSTSDRNRTLAFTVPVSFIDIKHLHRHTQDIVFYEVFSSFIHRVKLKPGETLKFDNNFIVDISQNITHSDYCIVGDCTSKEGLAAPLDEEDTDSIYKIEDCGKLSIPEFWFKNPNKDLFSNKTIEPKQF